MRAGNPRLPHPEVAEIIARRVLDGRGEWKATPRDLADALAEALPPQHPATYSLNASVGSMLAARGLLGEFGIAVRRVPGGRDRPRTFVFRLVAS